MIRDARVFLLCLFSFRDSQVFLDWQTFVGRQMVNSVGFVGHLVPAQTTQLCCVERNQLLTTHKHIDHD